MDEAETRELYASLSDKDKDWWREAAWDVATQVSEELGVDLTPEKVDSVLMYLITEVVKDADASFRAVMGEITQEEYERILHEEYVILGGENRDVPWNELEKAAGDRVLREYGYLFPQTKEERRRR